MKFYYVYKTINLINSKFYIGKHYNFLQDTYMGSGLILSRAFKKYGRNNFYKEIIEICTEENINEREKFWIKKLKNKNCYNIAEGGTGGHTLKHASPEKIKKWKQNLSIAGTGKKRTPEQCVSISKRQKGMKRFIKNNKEIYCFPDDNRLLEGGWKTGHSEEHNLKNSIANSGNKNGFYGKTHSEEIVKEMSERYKKQKWFVNKTGKTIFCQENDSRILEGNYKRGRKWKNLVNS